MRAAGQVLVAVGCWLLLSASMGWYYTITYFGAVGWPMPSMETLGALILYYFSVLNVATEVQAAHWLVAFPLAGALWVASLRGALGLMRRVGLRVPAAGAAGPASSRAACLFSLCTLPLALPMPYLVWLAGQTSTGWTLERMLNVALRRGTVSPWGWLSPMYLALALCALALHLWVYRRLYPMPAAAGAKHILLSAVVYVLIVAVMGSVAAWPLRWWLE